MSTRERGNIFSILSQVFLKYESKLIIYWNSWNLYHSEFCVSKSWFQLFIIKSQEWLDYISLIFFYPQPLFPLNHTRSGTLYLTLINTKFFKKKIFQLNHLFSLSYRSGLTELLVLKGKQSNISTAVSLLQQEQLKITINRR